MRSGEKQAVTLFVMAKNESRCIARCLSSARHLVDEIVVLDTGSSDETVSIAKAQGAKVHVTEWPGDFSKARNHGLSFVRTPWVLSLDADEWVIEATPDSQAVISSSVTPNQVFDVGMVMTSYDSDMSRAKAGSIPKLWSPRLFPAALRYTNPVHEVLVHRLPVSRSSILLGHDGYEEEQRRKKSGRNAPLLLERLKATPNDGLLYYYMAQELRAYGNGNTADDIAECFKHAIRLMSDADPIKEVVFREALIYFESVCDFERGIRVICDSLLRGVRSAELSYTAANFLMKCADSHNIDNDLLMDVAEKMLVRVATGSDRKSTLFSIDCDLRKHARIQLGVGISISTR
jgi:glycosyltransferase involved in cell wall biosynthesis